MQTLTLKNTSCVFFVQTDCQNRLYLVTLQDDLDPEEGVGCGLAVAIDGLGELLQGVLDIQPEGLLHHAVHLLRVAMPVLLHLCPVILEHCERPPHAGDDVLVRLLQPLLDVLPVTGLSVTKLAVKKP